MKHRTVKPIFTRLIEKTVEEGDCLIWTGCCANGKWPQWNIDYRPTPVRRTLWEQVHERSAKRLEVGTSCGTPKCVHPDHLVARSRSQRMKGIPLSPANVARVALGRRRKSKLNIDLVRQIRASDEPGNVVEERLGLKAGYASRIRSGRVWRDHASPFAGLGERVAA